MAHTYALKGRGQSGDMQLRVVDLTFVDNYATGGFPIASKDMGLGTNGTLLVLLGPHSIDGYQLQFDDANSKLVVYQGDNANAGVAPGVELANASAALAGKRVRLVFLGKGAG